MKTMGLNYVEMNVLKTMLFNNKFQTWLPIDGSTVASQSEVMIENHHQLK